MHTKIDAIVIDIVKYSDSRNVVTLYSRQLGRISTISSAGNTKAGRARNALLRPLSIITADINMNPTRDLQHLGQISPLSIWHDIYYNPYKTAVAIYITEFLNRYLKESAPDPLTFDFIARALEKFDSAVAGVANFHIAFLIKFMEPAGISPDISGIEEGDWFDLREGTPTADKPLHNDLLTPAQTSLLPKIMRMNFDNMHCFKFSAAERRECLNIILNYYAMFFPGVNNLKSSQILTELFN